MTKSDNVDTERIFAVRLRLSPLAVREVMTALHAVEDSLIQLQYKYAVVNRETGALVSFYGTKRDAEVYCVTATGI